MRKTDDIYCSELGKISAFEEDEESVIVELERWIKLGSTYNILYPLPQKSF